MTKKYNIYLKHDKEYSLGETLFWKVWKNKYLQRTILNLLKTHFKVGVYSFDEIVSVQWLLRNNYIELLKYKVKRRDLLVDFFDIKNELVENDQSSRKLLNLFKEVKNDSQFYRNLFNNYPCYFNKFYYGYQFGTGHLVDPIRYKTIPYSIKEFTLRQSMMYDNVDSFSLLEYENVEKFYEAIEQGSVNIAKYLFNTKLRSQKNDIVGKVWKHHTFINSTSCQEPKHYNFINNITKLLIVDLKLIPPKEMNKISVDFFTVDFKSLTVSELYECCFTVALLLEQTQFFKEYLLKISKGIIIDKYMNYDGILQNYIPNPLTDFFTTTQIYQMKLGHNFLDQCEMSSRIISLSKDDENVYKLLKMLLPFTSYSRSFKDNFFYFKFKYSNSGSLNLKVQVPSQKTQQPEEIKENNKKKNYIEFNDVKFGSSIENFIFENQEFINSQSCNFPNYESFETFTNNPIVIKPKFLLNVLFTQNRLDLITQVLDKLLKDIPKQKLFPFGLLYHIKSIEVFDYLLKIKSLEGEFSFENCLENDNGLNLMAHIKRNHNELYLNFLASIDGKKENTINYSFQSLMFIYENIKDFEDCYERINIWTRWNYFSLTLEQFIQLVEYTPITKKYSYHCGTLGNDDLILKRLNWVKNNRPYELYSGRCDREYGNQLGFDTETPIHIYEYYIGNIDKLKTFSVPENIYINGGHIVIGKFFSKVFSLIGSHGDVIGLEILMKILEQGVISENRYYDFFYYRVLVPILIKALINCKFKVFDFLKMNYPWIFDHSLINIQELEDINRIRYIERLYSELNLAAIKYCNITFIELLRSNYFKELLTKK
ncbi:hypothetical protein RB653_003067 [Dictyostelium firmibasis]|uniref:Uncharacterized protein n=1 Tax=Dictyostelium firmibasis TaxID=79012 RepID=A0AAN7TRN9_9MYCE